MLSFYIQSQNEIIRIKHYKVFYLKELESPKRWGTILSSEFFWFDCIKKCGISFLVLKEESNDLRWN